MTSRAIKYVFIDESDSKIDGRRYHAAIATVWRTSILKQFRLRVSKTISKLISPPRTINPLPEIHGSDMAPGHTDDVKLGCYEAVSDLLAKFDVSVYRLGYFDEVPLLPGKFDSLSFSINQLCDQISRSETGNLIFVYELNSAAHARIAVNYNDTYSHYVAATLGYENMTTPNFKNVIGRFYCDKQNLFMCATDVAGYYLLQLEKQASGMTTGAFSQKSFKLMKPIGKCVRFNEIVQMNDWPRKRVPNGPPRRMRPIVPSDTEDIQYDPAFDEALQQYWLARRTGKSN